MSTQWIVRTDGRKPEIAARHLLDEWGRPACFKAGQGAFRILEPHELERFRRCGSCVPAEHEGPLETAAEAAGLIRGAASALALASLDLAELGYPRMASSMRTVADRLFESADFAEPES